MSVLDTIVSEGFLTSWEKRHVLEGVMFSVPGTDIRTGHFVYIHIGLMITAVGH